MEKKIHELKTHFLRENKKLVLSRQMFAVRYDILNWLIGGMSGHETGCADSLPTVRKKQSTNGLQTPFVKDVCRCRSVSIDLSVRLVLRVWASHRAEKSSKPDGSVT